MVASVWVVQRRQPTAWKPNDGLPWCTCDLPPIATTPTASLPFVCRLKVVESSRGQGLMQNPHQYGTALRNLSPTKPLIVILSWCGGICGAPTAKSPAGLCGRWNEREGRSVYTCALSGDWANCKHRIIDGTRLPGLWTFSWSKSHHMAIIWIWPPAEASTIWIWAFKKRRRKEEEFETQESHKTLQVVGHETECVEHFQVSLGLKYYCQM